MMDFITLSVSKSLEKCPGPEPKSRIVLNLCFISWINCDEGGMYNGRK
jgi:hypothetical protein